LKIWELTLDNSGLYMLERLRWSLLTTQKIVGLCQNLVGKIMNGNHYKNISLFKIRQQKLLKYL